MNQKIDFPTHIEVRGAKVHNLKNIDVDIPLNKFVAISGLSGSGKSSLAMGILYEEGSRRYLEALSTYTRRKIKLGAQAQVTSVKYIPSALALKQRPTIPSERATVGTMSEVFNVIRLIFSRLGAPVCPNGHRIKPSLNISQAMSKAGNEMGVIICPTCNTKFSAFTAEDFSFNSDGACHNCQGTGKVRQLDDSKLIADENLSIKEGAVASWRLPGRNFMYQVAQQVGVRVDIKYKDLTDKEKDFVLNGESKKYKMDLVSSTGRIFHDFNVLYENAHQAVLESAKSSKSERAQEKINQFFHYSICPVCGGTKFRPEILKQLAGNKNIAVVNNLTLKELKKWKNSVLKELTSDMVILANEIFQQFNDNIKPLMELGLDYLALSRNGNTLSTGELQRIQLARTLRTETTGVLYVLDEPSIGLHPDNITGLLKVFKKLIEQGNSLVVVDHNIDILKTADWIIEVGPGSGTEGGRVIAQGKPKELKENSNSLIGPFFKGSANIYSRKRITGRATSYTVLEIKKHYNLNDLKISIPTNRITAITGFSGAGKSSLILDCLIPAMKADMSNEKIPSYVKRISTPLKNVVSVNAAPIGKSTRSTVATYTSIMDNLRKLFAAQPKAKELKYNASYFSYNNKQGACPNCNGTGVITLDIQYLPDMQQTCPVCNGDRYKDEIKKITWQDYSIIDILKLDVKKALLIFQKMPKILKELKLLNEVGLNYLHLGESTPTLSGGEAQRLKLIKYLNHGQDTSLFVFDEPSIGLHPIDVKVLLEVIESLRSKGATIIMITHDLNLMINADYMFDLGPKGGTDGGQIVANGVPIELIKRPVSLTTKYLSDFVKDFK